MKPRRMMMGILAMLSMATGVGADIPSLGQKNLDLKELGPGGIKPSIACDSRNQPHIVLKDSEYTGTLFLYHKTANGWRARETVRLSDHYTPAGALNNPHIEIDTATDRAWLSSIMMIIGNYDGVGMGVFTRGNVSTAPTALTFARRKLISAPGWATGNLSVEPGSGGTAGHAVGWINMGYWERWRWDNRVAVNGNGRSLFTMNLGERPTGSFRISRAAKRAHAQTGTHGVWHAAFNGHPNLGSLRYNGYQNSVRYENGQAPVTWLDSAVNSHSGIEEDNFVGLATDNSNPLAAYIAIDTRSGEILLNIFNGANMLRSATNPFRISGSTGYGLRWLPQLAPAKDSGAWLCFTSGGRIKLKYFGPDGTTGPTEDICPGTRGSIAVDANGDIHLVYMHNSRTMYQRIGQASLGLLAPQGKITDPRPVFTWRDATGNRPPQYRLWVMRDQVESWTPYIDGQADTHQFTGNLPIGNYRWWIAPCTAAETPPAQSSYAGPATFSIVPPAAVPVYPVDGFTVSEPEAIRFTWTQVAEANRYRLWINRNGQAHAADILVEGSANTTWIPADANQWPVGEYRWWVRADANDVEGLFSDGAAFTITPPPAPVPRHPIESIPVDQDVTLRWDPGAGATWHRVYVHFGGQFLNHRWLNDVTEWTPPETEATLSQDDMREPGEYTWWVRGWNSYGFGDWSEKAVFKRTRVMQPSGDAPVTSFQPRFTWTPSTGATWYRLIIQRDGVTLHDGWIGQGATSWQPSFDLVSGRYRWWVQAWHPTTGTGPWLDAAEFTMPDRSPVAAELLGPAGLTDEATPRFQWNPTPNATWYHLWIQRNDAYHFNQWFQGETNVIPRAAFPQGAYAWWVRTWNIDGFGPWSESLRFSRGTPVPLAPIGTLAAATPEFRWQAGNDAPWHQIWIHRLRETGDSVTVARQWVRDETTHTFAEPFPLGTYHWWIRSYEAGVYSPWSLVEEFVVP